MSMTWAEMLAKSFPPSEWYQKDDPKASTAEEDAIVKVVCAGCGTVIREGGRPVSHGVCPGCLREAVRACGLSESEVNDDLDRQDNVDRDGREFAEVGGES